MITKFYKGYTELHNKVPTSKRKSKIIKSEWQEVGGFLADNYVLVDIDDMDNANLFFNIINDYNIKCHVTESRHGIHAIFKKPREKLAYGNRKETLTGVICDYKCSNNKGYERIIIDGKQLPVIIECSVPDELPWLLFPFGKPRNLQQMRHGLGRHNTFMELSNVYAIYENDPNKILDTIKWVNANVFAEPRESVNITIPFVLDSIRYMNTSYDDTQIMDIVKDVDKNKLIKLLVQYGLIQPEVFK
nr:MAG TPA: hypothetical protein [Caudoviricetes sp.]